MTEQTIKPGERIIGRRAVALNGAEVLEAVWAGIKELIGGLEAEEGSKEVLERELEMELGRLAELGKRHLSFPNVSWKIVIGQGDKGVWGEVEISLTEIKHWKSQIGLRGANWTVFEIEQKKDLTPDRIRERWGLAGTVEIRTMNGSMERREIQFGGPRSKPDLDGSALQQQTSEKTDEQAVQRDDKLVRELVRLDKGDLLAETVEQEISVEGAVGAESQPLAPPSGAVLKRKPGKRG